MASEKPIRVAIIGLGFGAEFIPIYQKYPGAVIDAICRRDRKELDECGNRYGIEARFTDYRQLLDDPNIDAVHINSPIPDHAWMSLEALKAGKHVACTVPMGTSIDECRQIVEAQRSSGKVYMMMETVVYSREYLFVKDLYDKGELGRLQFLRGSHQQDMDGWPNYWPGLPPMWYATHCVSPCLAILGKHAQHVVCHGSGRIREDLVSRYGSPFAVETATFAIKDCDVAAEVTRTLFDVARQYRESFDAYGNKLRTKTRSSTPRARRNILGPSPRSRPASRYPTSPTSCPSRSGGLPSRPPFKTPTTSRSCREAATVGRIRTWYTRSYLP
jgi:predicted dehydrogenase